MARRSTPARSLPANAGPDLSFIHHRVPVTLDPTAYGRWLDVRAHSPADVADCLVAQRPGFFMPVPVSDRVNKVANADADIQLPVEPKPFVTGQTDTVSPKGMAGDDAQPSLF